MVHVVHVHDVNEHVCRYDASVTCINPSVCSYDASIRCQRLLAVCYQPMRTEIVSKMYNDDYWYTKNVLWFSSHVI